MFTYNSRMRVDYSARGSNVRVIERGESKGYKAVLAAISYERGVELIRIQEDAINHADYVEFLTDLQELDEN